MPPALPVLTQPLTRRTTLAAAPLLGLVGCRWGPEDDTATAPPTGSGSPTPAPDDDAGLAAEALAASTAVAALVTRVAARHRQLAGPLAEIGLMHDAHAALLAEAVPDAPSPSPDTGRPVPSRAAAALTLLRDEEQSLERTLTRVAGRAASGTFARAVASMAAAVAQRRSVLGGIEIGGAP